MNLAARITSITGLVDASYASEHSTTLDASFARDASDDPDYFDSEVSDYAIEASMVNTWRVAGEASSSSRISYAGWSSTAAHRGVRAGSYYDEDLP